MAKNGGEWKYSEALPVAEKVVQTLQPYCERIEIAGSLRRKRPVVHDIDLVAQPREGQELAMQWRLGFAEVVNLGPLIWNLKVDGIPVDLYLATEERFAMLLVVRTGSAGHNIAMASRARSMGLKFEASGVGITRDGARIGWRSEEEIFAALGMEYVEPERREA